MSKTTRPTDQMTVEEVARKQGEWKRLWQEASADAADARAELAAILNVDHARMTPLKIDRRDGQKNGNAVAAMICSDWHVFERVKPEEVNNLNEYSASIATRSIEKLFQTALRLTEIERSAINIRTFMLAFLGDLMTNQLHADQQETNDGTPQEEMLFLMERITGGIDLLLKHGDFDEIFIPCCDGNHGRATDKLRAANRVKHSHEWLLYCLLAKHYTKEPRVKFSIANGILHYINVYGREVRLTHGESVRFQGGVGGLTIPARKAIQEWDRAQRADFTVFAHFHTSILDKMFLSNGSAVGYSPYAVSIKAPFERPQQSFLVLDQERWLLSYRPIYVR